MDVDFWAARLHSAKHLHAVQTATPNNYGNYHLVMDNQGDDEVRAWFPCPFCYVEIEVPLLCVHLQEEHCFDLKNAVCPICAANLGRDALGHFTLQHAHSIKRRKKPQRSAFWSNVSTSIGKDFVELSSFLGTSSVSNEPAPDPVLSPFLCTFPQTVPKEVEKDTSAATNDVENKTPTMRGEVERQDYEERMQQTAFLQELLVSTILLEF